MMRFVARLVGLTGLLEALAKDCEEHGYIDAAISIGDARVLLERAEVQLGGMRDVV